jgi:hypothetical protein
VPACLNGKPNACVPGSPKEEKCNGKDDDCDGKIDEELVAVTCGLGACQRPGDVCVNGKATNCTPGAPAAETCNGIDDDCDGEIDNGLGELSCGVGACARTVPACLNGKTNVCVPGLPTAEVCNGLDDDCDGSVDEGLGTKTCGVGACGRTVEACANGQSQSCTAGSPEPEVCNGQDDDCNGTVDDGLAGLVEVCNGQDDDCNGKVDDACQLSQLVTAASGGTISITSGPLAGFKLAIPPGALDKDTEITVRADETFDPFGQGLIDPVANVQLMLDLVRVLHEEFPDWDKLQAYGALLLLNYFLSDGRKTAGPTVKLEPEGLAFQVPVTLTLPYDPAKSPQDVQHHKALRILSCATATSVPEILHGSTVDSTAHTVTVQLKHFSWEMVEADPAFLVSLISEAVSKNQYFWQGVGSPLLALFDGTKTAGTELTGEEIATASDCFVRRMKCATQNQQLDLSTPARTDVNWYWLAMHLSRMPLAFGMVAALGGMTADEVDEKMATGQEEKLFDHIMAQSEPQSYEKVLAKAVEYNGGNAYNAFMTMHNLVRYIDYNPEWLFQKWGSQKWAQIDTTGTPAWGAQKLGDMLAPMSVNGKEVEKKTSAWYHMSGLAALSMWAGSAWMSTVMSNVDENLVSGFMEGRFDKRDVLTNLVGAEMGAKMLSTVPASCDPPVIAQGSHVELECQGSVNLGLDQDPGCLKPTWTLVSGGGTLNGTTYQGPDVNSTAVVQVTNDWGTDTISIDTACQCPDLAWDSSNPQTIGQNASVTISVTGGKAPYVWNVAGKGFSLASGTTNVPTNTLSAAADACGTATITATGCGGFGKAKTGYVRSTAGAWHDDVVLHYAPPNAPYGCTPWRAGCMGGGSDGGTVPTLDRKHRALVGPGDTAIGPGPGCGDMNVLVTWNDGFQRSWNDILVGNSTWPRGCFNRDITLQSWECP